MSFARRACGMVPRSCRSPLRPSDSRKKCASPWIRLPGPPGRHNHKCLKKERGEENEIRNRRQNGQNEEPNEDHLHAPDGMRSVGGTVVAGSEPGSAVSREWRRNECWRDAYLSHYGGRTDHEGD